MKGKLGQKEGKRKTNEWKKEKLGQKRANGLKKKWKSKKETGLKREKKKNKNQRNRKVEGPKMESKKRKFYKIRNFSNRQKKKLLRTSISRDFSCKHEVNASRSLRHNPSRLLTRRARFVVKPLKFFPSICPGFYIFQKLLRKNLILYNKKIWK